MAVTLLTGATGLVGAAIARRLVRRGDHVRVTVREGSPREPLAGLGVEEARADVTDRRAVRRAMRDVTRVFHCAGSTNLRWPAARLDGVNVEGTRVVLEEALRAGVERVVHTSSVAAIGPAPDGATPVDERHVFPVWAGGIPYANSKREAEAVAMRLAARGLPVVVVNPSNVFGPGDLHRSSTDLVRRFLRREIPAYVDGTLNVVDVDDVARGHLLADERGVPGERYVLGGRNFTFDRLFADLGRLSGVEPPAVKLPAPAALALAEAAERLPGRPLVTVAEVRAASCHWAYRATKARRDLGWRASPHEETLRATIEWWREREGDRLAPAGARQPLALRAAGGVLGLVRR